MFFVSKIRLFHSTISFRPFLYGFYKGMHNTAICNDQNKLKDGNQTSMNCAPNVSPIIL